MAVVVAMVVHSPGSQDVSDVSSRPYFSSLVELNSLRSTDFRSTDFRSTDFRSTDFRSTDFRFTS